MKRALTLLALALALLAPAAPAAAEEEGARDAALLRAENERLATMRDLLAQGVRPDEPPPPELPLPPALACAASPARVVEVASAEELRAALAGARPGDLIRLADGVYSGRFVAAAEGTAAAPITLCGTRRAILDGGSISSGYGLHLTGDHWRLRGFTVSNALKGLMLDGASHTVISGLAVHTIGDEAVHFRAGSSDNLLERSWIHGTGLRSPRLGEGVYIGSAHGNWGRYTEGRPDASDRNSVRDNLFGPGVAAEAVDVKEGTTGGTVSGNSFVGGLAAADAWVNVKGNGYVVEGNRALAHAGAPAPPVAVVHTVLEGWGRDNVLRANTTEQATRAATGPFRAAHMPGAPATIVLPARATPYTLAEVVARFPASFKALAPGVLLLKEHLLVGRGASLTIDSGQVHELRLLSGRAGFVSLVGFRGSLTLAGTPERPLRVVSWDAAAGAPDGALEDGRAYVLVRGGRMDIAHAVFADLGFGLGQTSGVAWKGFGAEKSRGDVRGAQFLRNQFGAYTYEAEGMRWVGNLFADNRVYGFDPHDFSNNFVVERNVAARNGSHGIIFSRGCEGNLIRGNLAVGNLGHGIFIDDGKVVANGAPRYAVPVPSDRNRVEGNTVWGNDVGIAFEGGRGNVVRGNHLRGNRTGMRLNDDVSDNVIAANTIVASAGTAIYVFSGSARNHIVENRIAGARAGVVLKDAPDNRVAGNAIAGITGRGVVVEGAAGTTSVAGNAIAGSGSRAIDIAQAVGLDPALVAGNDAAWVAGAARGPLERATAFIGQHPAILLWLVIFLAPLSARLLVRRRTPGDGGASSTR